jgi:LPXTG-site transpeptidase (sortase) family protein
MRTPLYLKVIPVYAILLVIFVTPLVKSSPTDNQMHMAYPATESSFAYDETAIKLEKLEYIEITKANIKLRIVEASVDEKLQNTWTVTDGVANYLPGSSVPSDNSGRTILYAHDKNDGFHNIRTLKEGDQVYIRTNLAAYVYNYENSAIVSPTDISVITDKADRQELALITCDGFWSNNRYIVYLKQKV